MLSKRDAQFGRDRPVAPDTFFRGSDPKAHAPTLLLRLGGPCRTLRRLRASVADPGGAAPTRLLALAHPGRCGHHILLRSEIAVPLARTAVIGGPRRPMAPDRCSTGVAP
jgi:hypothetical protein